MPSCRTCGGPVTRHSKSGLCKVCARHDPEINARRVAGIAAAFKFNPEKRQRQIEAVRAANRRPERRERSGELARSIRLWEAGHKGITQESYRKAGSTRSHRALAHIPLAYHDDYRLLMKKVGAQEAGRLVQELAAKVLERAHA